MQHLLFRYLIPGIFLITPIYISIISLTLSRELEKNLTTLTTAIVIPLGYIFFQGYRIVWQKFYRGYENSNFINIIRDNLKVLLHPVEPKIFLDFRKVIPSIGIRWFTYLEFKEIFKPFANNQSLNNLELDFLEPVSDIILFSEKSYDYARSVSTVRYSTHASIFALITGGVIAFFIKYLNSSNIRVNMNYENLIITLSLVLAVLIIITLIYRRRLADTEYNSRLLLLTIINLESRKVSENDMEIEILQGLGILTDLDYIINLDKSKNSKIAAFDMDDTLLIGDIGDAVLAELIIEKKLSPEIWSEYQKIFRENRDDGYRFTIKSMAGLTLNDVLLA